MFYDVSFLWLWLALAVLLGGFVGWRNEVEGPQAPWFNGWVRYALIALIVGVIVALFGLLPGRAGFWLETAVLFFVAYLIGGLAGGALKRLRAAV
ncbi:MAG TPA: hypothetical protein VN715_18620 [Roseiarcus sp.]|nr:hypothetical protein [Roseiarcus sp.]